MNVINGGITTGYVYNLKDKEYYYQESITDVLKEIDFFNNALNNTHKSLEVLFNKTTGTISDLIKMQMLVLKDKSVNEEVIKRIENKKESAGTAYSTVVNKYAENLNNVDDQYIKERANDLLDIKEKVLKEMYCENIDLEFDKETILIVDSLKTSTVLNLSNNVKGIISKTGSNLSHAAILTKEKDIVYIVDENINFEDDTLIYIDTYNNIIKEKESYNNLYVEEPIYEELKEDVRLYLNVSDLRMLKENLSDLYEGVGLVRSELLFSSCNGYPLFETQVEYYKEILSFFYPKRVNIRLFDIKEDKEFFMFSNYNINEFLFNGPLSKIYKEQLKALLVANEPYGNLNILIPMINNVEEYYGLKQYSEKLRKKLLLINKAPKVGIMLETKKSFENIANFADVEFINIGTNDLCEELYGINRKTSLKCQKQLKKLINDINIIVDFANEQKIPFIVCGDHASTEEGINILLNKGINTYSIADGFLNKAIKIINNSR